MNASIYPHRVSAIPPGADLCGAGQILRNKGIGTRLNTRTHKPAKLSFLGFGGGLRFGVSSREKDNHYARMGIGDSCEGIDFERCGI